MKLAYVCCDPGVPVFGSKGGSIHVQSVLGSLVRRGVEVVLYARRVGGNTPAGLEGIRLEKLAKAPRGQTVQRERFLLDDNQTIQSMLAKEDGFDVIYERHSLWSYGAMAFACDAGIPGVLEVNAPLVEEQLRYRTLHLVDETQAAVAKSFAAAGAVLAVSRELGQWLDTQTAARGRVHVVSNGVDVERFGNQVKPRLSTETDVVTIGFVGSLRPWHGVDQLLAAFLRLRKAHRSVRLVIVGDGPMRAELEAMIAQHDDAKDAVIFVGSVEPDSVPGWLASMDIAVVPYPALEGFYFSPLKLYEYMASGRAIVASAVGQVCDVIADGYSGLLYRPGDIDSMCGALVRLVGDRALRLKLGSNARDVACREHSWDRRVEEILQIASTLGGVRV